MTLYEINEEILNCIDMETGEIVDRDRLEQLQMQRDIKIENIALWIKNLNAEITAISDEEKSLKKRRESKTRKRDSLLNYLSYSLDGETFETARVRTKYNKGEAVNVFDEKLIPLEYWRQKDPEINRAEIKKAIKAGKEVAGATLEATYTLKVV